jgi:hypothetical protein
MWAKGVLYTPYREVNHNDKALPIWLPVFIQMGLDEKLINRIADLRVPKGLLKAGAVCRHPRFVAVERARHLSFLHRRRGGSVDEFCITMQVKETMHKTY